MKKYSKIYVFISCLVTMLFFTFTMQAQDVPGTIPDWMETPNAPTSLSQIYSATGNYSLSVDAVGAYTTSSMTVDVQKPTNAATVEMAILMSSETWDDETNDCITLEGNLITWDGILTHSIWYSFWADVTTIVATAIDGQTAGIYALDITECNTQYTDGEVLIVVFNDATAGEKTVIVMWGGQNPTGDNFAVTLAEPIDPADPDAFLDMGLGIGYGYQTGGSQQYSEVNVNSQRVTSAAGGEDDGEAANGGLITAGGLGDLNTNPVDPYATPTGPRSDDELYSLLPFIDNTTTSLLVNTINPSNDDNLFLAYFCISGAAIIGEGILLSQTESSGYVGTSHTVKATVVDDLGDPVVGRMVDFEVISGPNAGLTHSEHTTSSGEAFFTYTDTGGPGFDQIEACFLNSQGLPICSNVLTFEWMQQSTDDLFLPCRVGLGNYSTTTVALGDLDGDGDDDLVEGNFGEPNIVYCNMDYCTYTVHGITFGANTFTHDIALGDLDGDGDLDAFEANDGANKVYLNNDPLIVATAQDIDDDESMGVALGDVDGDGDLDAFVANWDGLNKIYLNDGSGFFVQAAQTFQYVDLSTDVALADLDGDGDLDAIVSNYGSNSVYQNLGAGVYQVIQGLGNANSTSVSLGDFDSDGDMDAFFTNYNQPNTAWVNNASGSFWHSGLDLGTYLSWDAAVGDLDDDGDLDAFIAADGPNKLLFNDLLLTIYNGPDLGTNMSYAVALSDLDGDGDLDAFVGNYGQPNVVWMNQHEENKSAPAFADFVEPAGTLTSYPNPFNYQTNVVFTLENAAKTRLVVYNSLGQEVMVLFDGYAEAGQNYQVVFNGEGMPEGLYICRLQSGDTRSISRMLLAR